MSDQAQGLHIHVENRIAQDLVYHVTRERMDGALERHPEIAARIAATTISYDLEGFDDAVPTADVIVLPTPVLAEWRPSLYRLAELAPRLKFCFQTGAGAEKIMPLDWLPDGAVLTNNSGAHAEKAGEFMAMAILMLNNRLPHFITRQKAHDWDESYATHVGGKTLLVVGVGNMGGAGAAAAKKLGMHVIGVRPSGAPHQAVDEMATPDRLHEMLPRADFVLCATPLTAETRGMMGRAEFALMKPTAGLISMGRGAVIDNDALVEALSEKKIDGAILDVTDPEPLPADSPMWDVPNLVITPHMSSDDAELYIPNTLDVLFENLRRLLAGEPLLNQVDAARGY